MADFKLVYKGSRSMRGMELEALGVFWGGAVAVLFLVITNALGGCEIESWRLNAAGSMSGILGGCSDLPEGGACSF